MPDGHEGLVPDILEAIIVVAFFVTFAIAYVFGGNPSER